MPAAPAGGVPAVVVGLEVEHDAAVVVHRDVAVAEEVVQVVPGAERELGARGAAGQVVDRDERAAVPVAAVREDRRVAGGQVACRRRARSRATRAGAAPGARTS